jgi:hypothetical protein
MSSSWALARAPQPARQIHDLPRPLGASRPCQHGLLGSAGAPSITLSNIIPALPATIIGIPAGIALVAALSHGDPITVPVAWLVAVFLWTLLTVAALSSIPASLNAHQPVAEILKADS